VYQRTALKLSEAVCEEFGEEISFELNPNKTSRRGSFEITLIKDGKETLLWSGLKKGPPRNLKFPAASDVVSSIKACGL